MLVFDRIYGMSDEAHLFNLINERPQVLLLGSGDSDIGPEYAELSSNSPSEISGSNGGVPQT